MNNKKKQVWLPLLFSITMILGMFFGYKMRDNIPGKSFFYTEKRKPIQEILDLINNRYVDDVQIDKITDTAIQAMLSQLDPHSVYIPASELQQANEDLAGKFFGIGIEFNIIHDTLHVVHVLKDGPAYKAGLLIGDQLIKIDDSLVAGNKTDADAFRQKLRGTRGSVVTIKLLRNKQLKDVTLTRDAIPLVSVDASYMMTKDIGYIRLNKFSSVTYREFMQSLESLKKAGLQKLILDLRGNGGGILDEAVEIADEFLAGDKLITYTEGKHVEKKEYRCRRNGMFETGALYVLADEGSASASEVLLGALQDWDRATIIGRRSFGKGLVQEQFDLKDRSALRLTIARYYTPLGRSIQRPYSNGESAYFEEISKHLTDSTTSHADSSKNKTGKLFKTKSGKSIYDKGGITPDYFIAMDTVQYSKNSMQLFKKGTINSFVYYYYMQHQNKLAAYKSTGDFMKGFNLDDVAWQQFKQAAAADSVDINLLTPSEKSEINNQLKAYIARQIWRSEGYFEIMNATDAFIKKALELIIKEQ